MNRGKMLLVALGFVVGVSSGFAGVPEHNGQWWQEQESTTKHQYASRMFDGLTIGANLLEFGMSAQVKLTTDAPVPAGTAFQQSVRFDGGQLVDGLDRFYSDPRNTNVLVSRASRIFVHTVAGTPRDVLRKMTEESRKPGC
jgi:hypothetical protein